MDWISCVQPKSVRTLALVRGTSEHDDTESALAQLYELWCD